VAFDANNDFSTPLDIVNVIERFECGAASKIGNRSPGRKKKSARHLPSIARADHTLPRKGHICGRF
jgi:hypothetical protein